MKSDVMHSRVQDGPTGQRPKDHQEMSGAEGLDFDGTRKRTLLKPAILEQLVTEVKETVATEVELTKEPKSFGIVNLWNIRRTRNYAGKPRQKATIKTGISY